MSKLQISTFSTISSLAFVLRTKVAREFALAFNAEIVALSAVLATFNNIGPGLGSVGPTANFGDYSVVSKLVMTFDMLLGRLEIYPILALFTFKALKGK